MVKLNFRREHVSGNVSIGSTMFISENKALAAIAGWSNEFWTYTIVSIERIVGPKSSYVASNGQLV